MSGFVTVNRLSLVQLHSEERKQRAHLKKIAEMQRRSGLDNNNVVHFPHLNQGFSQNAKDRRKEIAKENDVKSKKLLEIMKSKTIQPPPPFHPTNPNRRQETVRLSHNNADYLERIAKTKGIYDVREWKKGFEEHKEHLKISKDNKLFTPRDIGVNRQRVKAASVANSKRTTPTSSTLNMNNQFDNNN
jgi:hypothetical protein